MLSRGSTTSRADVWSYTCIIHNQNVSKNIIDSISNGVLPTNDKVDLHPRKLSHASESPLRNSIAPEIGNVDHQKIHLIGSTRTEDNFIGGHLDVPDPARNLLSRPTKISMMDDFFFPASTPRVQTWCGAKSEPSMEKPVMGLYWLMSSHEVLA